MIPEAVNPARVANNTTRMSLYIFGSQPGSLGSGNAGGVPPAEVVDSGVLCHFGPCIARARPISGATDCLTLGRPVAVSVPRWRRIQIARASRPPQKRPVAMLGVACARRRAEKAMTYSDTDETIQKRSGWLIPLGVFLVTLVLSAIILAVLPRSECSQFSRRTGRPDFAHRHDSLARAWP